MRLREGDPLEIYTSNSGEIVLKKYSPMGELSIFSSQYADVLFKISEAPVAICDRDHAIAVAGVPKREVLERRVSPQLEELMKKRKNFQKTDRSEVFNPIEGLDRNALVAVPIIANGDLGGVVVLLESDDKTLADDTQVKLINAAAMFLSKQIEP